MVAKEAALATMQNWKIIHIPGELPNSQQQEATVNMFASKIEPKLASTLVRHLNLIAPLGNLGHVKRVRRTSVEGKVELSILLCLVESQTNDLEKDLPGDVFELINTYQLEPFIARVPKYVACSREEWQAQCQHWPTSYHPNACHIQANKELTEEETILVHTFMKVAIEKAKVACKSGQLANGAVIVDPSIKEIIAYGHDQTGSWPPTTNECLIKDADWNYQSQLEGTKSAPSCDVESQPEDNSVEGAEHARDEGKNPEANAPCLNIHGKLTHHAPCMPNTIAKYVGSYPWHPLRHAVMVAVAMAAERDRVLFPDRGSSLDQDCQKPDLLPSMTGISIKRQRTTWRKSMEGICEMENPSSTDYKVSFEATDLQQPYLCTGFDVYVTWEPCAMFGFKLKRQVKVQHLLNLMQYWETIPCTASWMRIVDFCEVGRRRAGGCVLYQDKTEIDLLTRFSPANFWASSRRIGWLRGAKTRPHPQGSLSGSQLPTPKTIGVITMAGEMITLVNHPLT